MKKLIAPAFALVLLLTGCNVFEGLYEAGTSNDPEVLLADAEQAVQQGEPEKAVVILEKAVEQTQPKTVQRSKVQIQLATAKMQAAKIGVLQLQRMIEDMNDRIEIGKTSSGKIGAFASQVCSYEPTDERLEQITLNDIDGYTAISQNQDVLSEVQRLVNEALNFSGDPGERFDIQARIDSLQQAGLSQQKIAEALLNASLAYVGGSYDDIVQVGGDQIEWYRVRSAYEGYYLGYCAPSQDVIDTVKAETACSMDDLKFSVDLLRARAAFYDPNSLAGEIADKAQEGYDKLQDELDGTCGG